MGPPAFLDELLALGLGVEWPLSDPDRLRAAARAWQTAATGLDQVIADLRAAAATTRGSLAGEPLDAFDRRWAAVEAGPDGGALGALRDGCARLAAACDAMATDVDAAEEEFTAAVVINAVAIMTQFAAGVFDFGISDATGVAELGALRGTLQGIVTTLVDRIGATQTRLLADATLSGLIGYTRDTANQLIEIDHGLRRGFSGGEAATSGAVGITTVLGGSALREQTGTLAARIGFDPARVRALNDNIAYQAGTTALAYGTVKAASGRDVGPSDLVGSFTQGLTARFAGAALDASGGPATGTPETSP